MIIYTIVDGLDPVGCTGLYDFCDIAKGDFLLPLAVNVTHHHAIH